MNDHQSTITPHSHTHTNNAPCRPDPLKFTVQCFPFKLSCLVKCPLPPTLEVQQLKGHCAVVNNRNESLISSLVLNTLIQFYMNPFA